MIELLQRKKDIVQNKKNYPFSNIKSNLSSQINILDKKKDSIQKETLEMDYLEHFDIEIINQNYNSQQKKMTEKCSENNDNMFTPSFTQQFEYMKNEGTENVNTSINYNSGARIQNEREIFSFAQSRVDSQARGQDSRIDYIQSKDSRPT